MYEIMCIILGYIYGSIPFALVIGKLFYNTDVRKSGSGNLGGTNAGRVLGKKAGVAVIILDALKAAVIVLLTNYLSYLLHFNNDVKYIAGVACIIGHCWPVFAQFKGGKAVSTSIGYFLCIAPVWAILSLVVFFIVLKISKYVSLSSIIASASVLFVIPTLDITITGKICLTISIFILIFRHKENIKRIINGTESKITWM